MYKTSAVVLVSLLACLPLAAQTMEDVAFADVIVVGRVSSEPSAVVRLQTLRRSEEPPGPKDFVVALGLYEVEVQQTLKGAATGTIRVVAPQGDLTSVAGGRDPLRNESSGLSLPRGARMMLFLQVADSNGAVRYHRNREADPNTYRASDFVRLPEGVRYAVTDFHERWHSYIIPDSAPEKFPLKHDSPGKDMMRVWVRATEGLPVDDYRGLSEEHGLVRVSLWPTEANFDYSLSRPYVSDRDRKVANQFGPDPLKFYREEIAPNLPPIGPKTTELQIILRHVIAGTYGDPDAAKQIADVVLALDTSKSEKLREHVAEIVGGLGLLPNGREAAVSLYSHRDPLIVQKALMNPFRPDEGKKYAKQVVALLDHEWEGVRLEALRILSMIYREPDKDWTMDKLGSGSYPSEELIQYWKDKVKD